MRILHHTTVPVQHFNTLTSTMVRVRVKVRVRVRVRDLRTQETSIYD